MRSLVVLLVLCATAAAQPSGDDAIALALFEEGRGLVSHGDYERACVKFEAARARVPWLGVALNLADCYAHLGKLASAWALFRQVADRADHQGDPRAAFARKRAAELWPAVSHVTIARVDGSAETIHLDHQLVATASLNLPLPVDPGEHLIEATGAGAIGWSRRIVVEARAAIDVAIPHLERVATPVLATSTAPPIYRRSRIPLVLGGVGVLAVGGAAVLAFDARRDYDAARDRCDAELRCDRFGFDAIQSARRRGTLATITGGVGLAMIAGAVVLYLRGSEHAVVPIATSTTVGVAVGGSL